MRSLDDLLNTIEPAWSFVSEWIAAATNPIEVLPPKTPDRAEALLATQVTTRSPLGAVIYETGGLLVDFGWLRVLGPGHPRLARTLPGWNQGKSLDGSGQSPPFLLIADDVLGGFFALNGGALGPVRGNVHYFAPDSLAWEDFEGGYSDFLRWCCSGDLAEYYGEYRWPGWEQEVAALTGDRAFFIFPPLWTRGPHVSARYRGTVPVDELYGLHVGPTPN